MSVKDILKAANRTGARVFVNDNNVPVRVLDKNSQYANMEVVGIMGFQRKCDTSRNSILLEVVGR